MWPVGLGMGVFFAIMVAIAWGQIEMMQHHKVDEVFDLMAVLFQGFWVLGWSAGAFVLGALTLLFLLYGETARIQNGRLVKVSRLGPIRIVSEYDLAKITDIRVKPAEKRQSSTHAKITCDYNGGTVRIGNAMSQAQAEQIASMVRDASRDRDPRIVAGESGFDLLSWGDRYFSRKSVRSEPENIPPHLRPVPESPAGNTPTALALIAANLVPLFGVVFLGWKLGDIMALFWAESAVIGFYNVLKIVKVGQWSAIVTAPFFVGHYGGFMSVHFLFIYTLFVRGVEAKGPDLPVLPALIGLFYPLRPALLAFFISHGVSFRMNFIGRKEYVSMKTETLMKDPYGRIFVMHLTVIFGGWFVLLFRSAMPALILLILLKITADFWSHRKQHGRAAPPRAGVAG